MPVKISKQLERSNCSLLSADNSIPEESEDEEEDIEEERIGKLGEEEMMSTSSFMEGEEGKRPSAGERLEKQGPINEAARIGRQNQKPVAWMSVPPLMSLRWR